MLNESQIVSDLICRELSEANKTELYNTEFDDLILLHHHTLGRYIRNHYKLWERASNYKSNDLNDSNHPDNMSQRIIEKIWNIFHEND